MAKITGKAYIDVPGFGRLSSNQGATLALAGVVRSAVSSDIGIDGYREENVAGTLSCTINHRKGLSLKQLGDLADVNVSFQTDTGSSWVLSGAWVTNRPSLSNGEINLEMESPTSEEVAA